MKMPPKLAIYQFSGKLPPDTIDAKEQKDSTYNFQEMTGDRKRLNPVLIFKDLITFTPERVKITPIGYISRFFFLGKMTTRGRPTLDSKE